MKGFISYLFYLILVLYLSFSYVKTFLAIGIEAGRRKAPRRRKFQIK